MGNHLGIRPFTFFEKGLVGHVGFADPFDAKIGKVFLRPTNGSPRTNNIFRW